MKEAQAYFEKGDLEEAFRRSIPYAIGIAKKFKVKGMDFDDIRSEALLSLWKALKLYDPSKGKLSSYVARTIVVNLMEKIRYWQLPIRDGIEVDYDDDLLKPTIECRIDLRIDIDRFVETLPNDLRQFFIVYETTLNALETGRILGYPPRTATYMMTKIRNRLKQFFNDDL